MEQEKSTESQKEWLNKKQGYKWTNVNRRKL